MTTIKELKFPVISIKGDEIIGVNKNEIELTTCTKDAFRKRFYNEMKLIDCNGKMIKVLSAFKKDRQGFFNTIKKRVKVRLYLKREIETINLAEFKKFLKKALKPNGDFWESGGSYSEMADIINSGITIECIIRNLKNKVSH